jgi:chromosomal replication initiation ATPase DnaA
MATYTTQEIYAQVQAELERASTLQGFMVQGLMRTVATKLGISVADVAAAIKQSERAA